jgi:hypothetical protein
VYRKVDEGRKRVLLIAASILAARHLANWDGRPSPASESTIANAIALAERIMSKIDKRWPVLSRRKPMAVELYYRCPRCPDIQQGVTLSDEKLKVLLDSGKQFTVMGLQCGHVWALPEEDIASLRAAFNKAGE